MSNELILKGIDGANPLGFLAAVGTLAVANDIWPGKVQLSWTIGTSYHPIITIPLVMEANNSEIEAIFAKKLVDSMNIPAPELSEIDKLVVGNLYSNFNKLRKELDILNAKIKESRKELQQEAKGQGLKKEELAGWLANQQVNQLAELNECNEIMQVAREAWLGHLEKCVPSGELNLGKTLSISKEEFRNTAMLMLIKASKENRRTVDLLASFAVESIENDKSKIEYTPFCFVTGSGHQYFLETVGKLMHEVDCAQIIKTLFSTWLFDDEKLSLRWAPIEDRRYALMWGNPSGQSSKTNWAANLLGYQGLRLFPVVDRGGKLDLGGFINNNNGQYFSWPIWAGALSLDCIRSLLTHETINKFEPTKYELRKLNRIGVITIFRSERMRVGTPPLEKINFSTAYPVVPEN